MQVYTRQELEVLLEQNYRNKILSFKYPGKDEVNGKCHNVSVAYTGLITFHIGDLKYEVSIECLLEVVSIISFTH